jgi:hypothetical protein
MLRNSSTFKKRMLLKKRHAWRNVAWSEAFPETKAKWKSWMVLQQAWRTSKRACWVLVLFKDSCLVLQRKALNRQCSSSSKTRRRIVETLASDRREGRNTLSILFSALLMVKRCLVMS